MCSTTAGASSKISSPRSISSILLLVLEGGKTGFPSVMFSDFTGLEIVLLKVFVVSLIVREAAL